MGKRSSCEEHMLGAAQPDPFRAECHAFGGVVRVVGVGPHAQRAYLVGPTQQSDQVVLLVIVRLDKRDCAQRTPRPWCRLWI